MANGNFGGGDGTVNNPFLVEDAYDLDAVRNNLSAHYKQVNDIDLSDWGNWEPIGQKYSDPFQGVYDGNGHKIINLNANKNGLVGLFGVLYGTCTNLGIVKCNVNSTGMRCGALAGHVRSSIVRNCYSTGVVSGTTLVGGLTGQMDSNSTVENVYSSCEVTGSNDTGGIAGEISGTITNCFALNRFIKRRADSTGTRFGDIYGSGSVELINCYSLDTLEFVQL